MSAYAVIRTGGKQYRVAADDVLVIEKLEGAPGDTVVFADVLLKADGEAVTIGAPTIAGAAVAAEILEQRKGEKVLIVKKRRRQTYRRRRGHRQLETIVRITALDAAPGAGAKPAAKAEPAMKTAAPEAAAAAPAADAAPMFLAAPEGPADDLKLIGGVGKVLEGKLHALGIYHFRQIAAFTPEDVARVDDALSFKGRIDREDWIGQAKELMAGGEPRAAVDKAAKKAKTKDTDEADAPGDGNDA